MFYSPFPNTREKSVGCQLYDLHFPIICRKKKKERQAPIALEMHSLQDWNLSPSSSSLLNPQHSNRVSVSHFPKKEEEKSLNKKESFPPTPFLFLAPLRRLRNDKSPHFGSSQQPLLSRSGFISLFFSFTLLYGEKTVAG